MQTVLPKIPVYVDCTLKQLGWFNEATLHGGSTSRESTGYSSAKRIFFKKGQERRGKGRGVDSDYVKARVHMSTSDFHNSVLSLAPRWNLLYFQAPFRSFLE